MAIVFISPKSKQGVFFFAISALVVLALAGISVVVFLPDFFHVQPPGPKEVTLVNPNTELNVSVLSSPMVKSFELFSNLDVAFVYTVTDKEGKEITGNISATTKEKAQKQLEDSGFTIVSLQEMGVGRANPFIAY